MAMHSALFLSVASAALLVPFEKRHNAINSLSRRDTEEANIDLSADGLAFYINFTIGGQDFLGALDTGSSDVWVSTASGCHKDPDHGTTCAHTFDTSESGLTVNSSSNPFNQSYGDGSNAVGYYAQDEMVVGEYTVTGANFAVATQANSDPVFGIGLAAGENSYYSYYTQSSDGSIVNDGGDIYRNFPLQLVDQGYINTAAFSLWLNSPRSYEGQVLFGGVDTKKFNGSLYTVPIELEPVGVNSRGDVLYFPELTRYLVMVDQINIHTEKGSQTLMEGPYPALLDSGSTVTSVPSQLAAVLYRAFGASSRGGYLIDCGLPKGGLGVVIRGQEFLIPFEVFVRTLHIRGGLEPVLPNGEMVCSPGILADDDTPFMIFGDSILEALYVVYDIDNSEISIGQALYDVEESSIEEIDSNGIPSATQAPDYSKSYGALEFVAATTLSVSVSPSAVTSIKGDEATRTTLRSNGDGGRATPTSPGIDNSLYSNGHRTVKTSNLGGASTDRSGGNSATTSKGSSNLAGPIGPIMGAGAALLALL